MLLACGFEGARQFLTNEQITFTIKNDHEKA
jgi:hypothetical protein